MASKSQVVTPSSASNLPSKLQSLTLESNNNFPPWLKLPDHLIKKILEHLTICDYVRFGNVCRHWCNIKANHHHYHAPSPPPMVSLPWFIPKNPQQEPVDCFSPFKHRSHHIMLPLSDRLLKRGIIDGDMWLSFSPNGWLVLKEASDCDNSCFFLLNPISGISIKIPVGNAFFNFCYRGFKMIVSPSPIYFVFRMSYNQHQLFIDLFREGNEDWSNLKFPDKKMDHGCDNETGAIIWKGRIYYMSWRWGLFVIDPLSCEPTVKFVEMDESPMYAYVQGWKQIFAPINNLFLVESNGRMLMVLERLDYYCSSYGDQEVMSFEVFEADLPNKRWVRMESLGDQVLFIHNEFICSLFADDIGVEGNCIYCQDLSQIEWGHLLDSMPWTVFNLGMRKLTKSSLPYAPTYHPHCMFVPSLC